MKFNKINFILLFALLVAAEVSSHGICCLEIKYEAHSLLELGNLEVKINQQAFYNPERLLFLQKEIQKDKQRKKQLKKAKKINDEKINQLYQQYFQ